MLLQKDSEAFVTAQNYMARDISDALASLGVENGEVVYVTSALWKVPGLQGVEPEEMPAVFYSAFRDVLGENGTIVVGTHSLNLCNTLIPFDPQETPSYERGVFSEYVRNLPGARRSFHPFASYSAVGPLASEIVDGAARNAYGPETPEGRLIERRALSVHIGMQPRILTTIHHVEHCMGVPYRYIKEFLHPVVRDGVSAAEPFYLNVQYRDIGLLSARNKKIFELLEGKINLRTAKLGRGSMFSFPTNEFFSETCKLFATNPYVWCEQEPVQRPYRD